MNINKTITSLMRGHHAQIEALLKVFKNSLEENAEDRETMLDKFKWEKEKHIFVEEKVIFAVCDSKDSEICKIVRNLIEDHRIMLEIARILKFMG